MLTILAAYSTCSAQGASCIAFGHSRLQGIRTLNLAYALNGDGTMFSEKFLRLTLARIVEKDTQKYRDGLPALEAEAKRERHGPREHG